MAQGGFAVDDLRLLQAIGENGSLSAASRKLRLDLSPIHKCVTRTRSRDDRHA